MSTETRDVLISYSPTKSDVGKRKTLPADEAATLVREGRATYVEPETEDVHDGDGSEASAAKPSTAKASRGGSGTVTAASK